MPTIVINSPTDVQIDGQSAGALADAIKNNPALAANLQQALVSWWTSQQDAHAAAQQILTQQISTLSDANAILKAATPAPHP